MKHNYANDINLLGSKFMSDFFPIICDTFINGIKSSMDYSNEMKVTKLRDDEPYVIFNWDDKCVNIVRPKDNALFYSIPIDEVEDFRHYLFELVHDTVVFTKDVKIVEFTVKEYGSRKYNMINTVSNL